MNTNSQLGSQLRPSISVDWSRDFISDQAYQFVRLDLDNRRGIAPAKYDLMLERCVAHLMALCNCSKRTAETHAAQAVAELVSRRSRVSFDMDRSTSYALFVVDRASGTTRVISAAELLLLLQRHETASAMPLTAAA
jgi:hypothetical protein